MEENIAYLCERKYPLRNIVQAPTVVIKAQEHNHERFTVEAWGKMIRGKVMLTEIPGTHISILSHPHVQKLAEVFFKVFEE